MKNINEIQYNPKMTAIDDGEHVPQQTIILINEVMKHLVGIYPSMLNTSDKSQIQGFKQQLTLAFVESQIFNFSQVEGAIKYFRSMGETFQPSVPEFIRGCRGELEYQVKLPEHVWFDRAKALPEFTPEQNQRSGLKGVASARQAMREAKARKYS
jgi:hypothetical protein